MRRRLLCLCIGALVLTGCQFVQNPGAVSVIGRIQDGVAGTALNGYLVIQDGQGQWLTEQSISEGYFRVTGLTPGIYRLRFIVDGYQEKTVEISLEQNTYLDPIQLTPTTPSKPDPSSPSLTIVLDPGHGGTDPGAVAWDGPRMVRESDINLAISEILASQLRSAGHHVVMTRTSTNNIERTLSERAAMADWNKADLFISIHADASPTNPSARGSNSYVYWGAPQRTTRLAYLLQIHQEQTTGRSPNALGRVIQRGFTVTHQSRPAVLVETGFMTNTQELTLLQTHSFQEKIAQGLFQGIIAWAREQGLIF
ncbi:MAG: N-acetylmuramoyl-L-alanine amidase [Limnochordia bacterium]|nr:N-acetylmuramoyl-L-alanine amidase [Limnochordia bacterium]MDD2630169.1 N-acetylmuramoyl-L-alanine amidase [Limnochordia bacterium]MDD4518267.1 N-acetylmuramoyl-L-alanine amidase [Limnochordia bacterium]